MRKIEQIRISVADRERLERLVRDRNTPQKVVWRADRVAGEQWPDGGGDCGVAVNPDQVRAQMEGGIGFGLGAILKSQITLDKGRIVEGNFDGYDVLRIDEMPSVEVHIVKSSAPPTGVGEPGVPPIGPAVANAMFKATGRRIRILPFANSENS
jgi:hypothetical protein